MKLIAIAFFVVCGCFGQTTLPPGTVEASSLPSYFASAGGEYNRYATDHGGIDISFGIRIGTTGVFSYTTIDTALVKTPSGGAPLPSSVRTGAASVVAQSSNGAVSLFICGQAGVSATAGSTSATLSGCLGIPIRFGKTHLYAMPMLRIANATSAGVQVVPEVQLLYGFGGK